MPDNQETNIKVTEMPVANDINDADIFMIVQENINKQIPFNLIRNVLNRPHKYTVRRLITQSSPAFERLDDAVNLVANATHDGTAVRNDFDNLYPWSDIISYNYDTKARRITAYYGDPQFAFDGSNGQVLTRIPKFWYKMWMADNYLYISIADGYIEGYIESPQFSLGRYVNSGSSNEGVFSRGGYVPMINTNITRFRDLCNNVGEGFGQLDYHYMLLQTLYLVEYASYYSQSVLGSGCTKLRVNNNDKALVAEENTNRIVVSKNSANQFLVGQSISLGTGVYTTSIAYGRNILSKEDYNENDVTGVAITFDGTPVNIAVGNVIWSSGQISGECDALGMKSGTLNDDGRHSVIYRGVENPYSNVWQFVDGLNIQNNVAYISYNSADYAVNKFDGSYRKLGYTNGTQDGWIKELGFDTANPLIQLPTASVGASFNTYITDFYWQANNSRIALVGGIVYLGVNCGFWCWLLNNTPESFGWAVGSRLLFNQ